MMKSKRHSQQLLIDDWGLAVMVDLESMTYKANFDDMDIVKT